MFCTETVHSLNGCLSRCEAFSKHFSKDHQFFPYAVFSVVILGFWNLGFAPGEVHVFNSGLSVHFAQHRGPLL